MLAGSGVYPFFAEVVLQDPTEHQNRAPQATPDHAERGGTPQTLDPKAVSLWRIQHAGRGALAVASLVAVELLLGPPPGLGLFSGPAALAALAAVVFLPPLQYDRWRFGFHDDHLRLRHGVLFRTTSIVPYARIQHVDTRNGPLDRWLGLASLVVFTAGTRGAILTIPALAADEAEELRDRLAALSGAGDAV